MNEINPRTRDNPEEAMLHQQAAPPVVNPDPKAQGAQGFDSEAHRAFMRGLG